MLLYIVLALPSGFAHAQVTPGTPLFSAYDQYEVDTIDLMNNNLIVGVPIRSKPNALAMSVAANSYFSAGGNVWSPSMSVGVGNWTGAPFNYAAGGLLGQGIGATYSNGALNTIICHGNEILELSGWSIYTADGTRHPIAPTAFVETGPCHNVMIATAIDGSGLTLVITGGSTEGSFTLTGIYLKNGTTVTQQQLVDANGNTLKEQTTCLNTSTSCTFIDSMGLTFVSMTTPNGITEPQFSWTDANGGTPAVSQSTTNYVLRTAFNCPNVADLNNSSQTAMTTGFSFPDSTTLGISYETAAGYHTGRISELTLRETGTISYTYTGGTNGIDCTYQNAPIITRTLSNGDTTTYTLTHNLISGSSYNAINTVVDPGGNETDYTFTGFNSTGLQAVPVAQVLTQVVRYQGKGTGKTLLGTTYYCYNTSFSSCSQSGSVGATVNYPINSVIAFQQLAGMSTWKATEIHYDGYGNTTYLAQYDFGGSTPVRATTTTYGSCSTNCNTANPTIVSIGSYINSLPGEVVTTQNGSVVAQTNYVYGSSGNLLTTYVWTGSRWLNNTTPNAYNSNGSPSATYDLANNATTYTYASSSYSDCSGCTSYPFPTSITKGGLITKRTYDGGGGVQLSVTDPNSNKTTFCYNTGAGCSGGTADPYWRVQQIIDPYGSTVVEAYPSGSSPDTASGSFTFNSSNSINATTITTDGYGRTINSQTAQSPSGSNYDTVTTAYSWSGNYQTVATSQPCSTTAGATCTTAHTSKFDPLGRLYTASTTSNETLTHTYTQNDDLAVLSPAPTGENAKKVQTEYDGLGRVSKVCHIGTTTSTGSGTVCGQKTGSSSGATDAYTYSSASGTSTVSVVRGSQTRSRTVDALGRVLSSVTPEGGTKTFVYDTETSCGPNGAKTSSGDLLQTTDANGNQVCYYYDALHRLTDVGNNHQSATNYCKRFRYDNSQGVLGAIPIGISVSNNLGRLVEAETDDCSVPITQASMITDEWFAYDKDGRVTDIWQLTPHSTQYYHSVATFFENGVVKTLELASPSLYTITYGLDGEGRLNTLQDGSTNVVTGPLNGMYDAAGHVLKVQLTGATPDQDIYTYDANTGRMKTFEFEVGNTPANLTGTLTWNANGTLGELQVVDGFNSGGSQTCYSNSSSALGYGYDDWARLAAFDCGSGYWGQEFSYDQYDNLTQTVISGRSGGTWNPGYNTNTNQVVGATYDSNGNMTNDGGSNVYGWDQFSELKWTAASGTPTCGTSGKCITYDAFGRAVETSAAGSWTEHWYTQVPGSAATMTGTTANSAYWPSPGRGIYLHSGTPMFLHPDWLGNVRIISNTSHVEVSDTAYAPYGEKYNTFEGTNPIYSVFAEMTGDFDPGILFDTPNREFAQYQGRWLSPDPAGFGWNQYAYATNPHSFVDPSGLFYCACEDDLGGGGGGYVDPSGGDPCFLYNMDCPVQGPSGPLVPTGGGGGGDARKPCLAGAGPLQVGQSRCSNRTNPCLSLSALTTPEIWELNAASFYAQHFNTTVGFGIGASGATGVFPGLKPSVGGTLSSMLVADSTGNMALVTTMTYNSLNFGAGVQGGLQVSVGGGPITPEWSGNASASGSFGAGLGLGVDLTNTGAFTLNLGAGLGAKYSATMSNLNVSYTLPICKQ